MADLLTETRRRCPELAEFLQGSMETPLRFEDVHPNMQSSHNHIHLWALEYWADRHNWIDLAYRVAFAEAIFARWRVRLTGNAPYLDRGYRLYLYEDMAPTVSVVAETDVGCPYGVVPADNTLAEVMVPYTKRSWSAIFNAEGGLTPERVLQVVERNKGSIGKPTAQALGLQVGHLRREIEWFGIGDEVNALRKTYKRRPVQFKEHYFAPNKMWEQVLPARY